MTELGEEALEGAGRKVEGHVGNHPTPVPGEMCLSVRLSSLWFGLSCSGYTGVIGPLPTLTVQGQALLTQ